LVAVVHEPQQQYGAGAEHVEGHHEVAPPHPVGQESAQWAEQSGASHREDHQSRDGVASGQALAPDPEDQQQSPVSEHRQALASQDQAEISVPQ